MSQSLQTFAAEFTLTASSLVHAQACAHEIELQAREHVFSNEHATATWDHNTAAPHVCLHFSASLTDDQAGEWANELLADLQYMYPDVSLTLVRVTHVAPWIASELRRRHNH